MHCLIQKKKFESFYTINGTVKYSLVDEKFKTEFTHEEDLVSYFGAGIMQEIDASRNIQ